ETLVGFVTQVVRGWNRMSIVIAALALAAVGLLVGALLGRITRRSRGPVRIAAAVIAGAALVGVAYWDQVPAADAVARAATVASFDSDAVFVAELQEALPPGAAVFQLPFIPFPESPPVGGALDPDQLRPYLHSETLRWSGGGIRGRDDIDRLGEVAALPPAAFVRGAEALGFAGVVLDRAGDPDGAIGERLADALASPSIVSPDSRFAYYSFG
ncbi:MAG TPA: hypothetical protein VNQ52_01570, partial [Microbacteriaceae bacterium]|nr:hypothetical protein [Microbacteriaceae bacterium]